MGNRGLWTAVDLGVGYLAWWCQDARNATVWCCGGFAIHDEQLLSIWAANLGRSHRDTFAFAARTSISRPQWRKDPPWLRLPNFVQFVHSYMQYDMHRGGTEYLRFKCLRILMHNVYLLRQTCFFLLFGEPPSYLSVLMFVCALQCRMDSTGYQTRRCWTPGWSTLYQSADPASIYAHTQVPPDQLAIAQLASASITRCWE